MPMAPLVPAALPPPTLASTAALGSLRSREQLRAPEAGGRADGIVDASQTSLCTFLGCYADKREKRQALGSQKSLELSPPIPLMRNLLC